MIVTQLGALGVLQRDPQHVLDAVAVAADDRMPGLVPHVRAVADLDDQRVNVDIEYTLSSG